MPCITTSTYNPPYFFYNGHISTIYSGAIKTTIAPAYQREKLQLPDGDFLLLDSATRKAEKAVILCHGLEGHSQSSYMNSCANYFLQRNFSVFAWNNRSCGGEMNLLPKLYHHASIEDLEFVVNTVLERGFNNVFLIGFSLGGAQILSYLGNRIPDNRVKAGVAVSTPIQLKSSAEKMAKGFGKIYEHQLVKKIKRKIIFKAQQFPELLSEVSARSMHGFQDIIQQFLAPVHGFRDVEDYFLRASPAYSLKNIQTPVLILNAKNDPILGNAAFPYQIAEKHSFVYLETPEHGGHCAFPLRRSSFRFSEVRAMEFFEKGR